MADVRSIGAGGGSIAWIDAAGRLNVGPRSSGAVPGPACYRRGGEEPTVTDAAVVAGLIDPARFLGGRMTIDPAAAREALERRVARPLGLSARDAAGGVLRLVTARMAQLIGEMTVRVGLDPRDYALVGFGGAGPLFVAALAEEVEAARAVVPRHPAVWSALGGLFADTVHDHARSLFGALRTVDPAAIDATALGLAELGRADLRRDGVAERDSTFVWSLDLRYAGQSHELSVELPGAPPFGREALSACAARFEDLHERTYAHRRPEDPLELTTVRLRVRCPRRLEVRDGAAATGSPRPTGVRAVAFHGHGADLPTTIVDRASLAPGARIDGPAIVEEDQSGTVVPPGHALTVADDGSLILDRNPR
jgi:N-methylhydantoinase A